MWQCTNCNSDVEDKYSFCWRCGTRRVLPRERSTEQTQQPSAHTQRTSAQPQRAPVPAFESFEQLAPEPASHAWIFRRGLRMRIVWYVVLLVIFVLLKILASTFVGKYGLYIFIGVAVVALLVILWRSFHRDETESVGIKLD